MNFSLTQLEELLRQPTGSSHLFIRAVQLRDTHTLAEILADSFHSRQGWAGWLYPIFRLGIYEDLRNRLRACPPNYVCLVAGTVPQRLSLDAQTGKSCDYLIGTVEMAVRTSCPWFQRKSPYLYVSNLAVRPECRRQGVAGQLLEACERIAIHWSFQDLYLHVLEDNHQARNLYSNHGYRVQQVDIDWSLALFGQSRRLFLHKRLTACQ